MRAQSLMAGAFLCGCAAGAGTPQVRAGAHVVPLPQSLHFSPPTAGSRLTLARTFAFTAAASGASSSTLSAALVRFRAVLFGGAHVGGAAPTHETGIGRLLRGCSVCVQGDSLSLTPETNESYTLSVRAAGSCAIEAPTVYGAMHGMETFVQLVRQTRAAGGMNMSVPLVTVVDRPRFPLRATMIDTARRFLPLQHILRHIDAMACVKMNLLHWHLVDSQSWPFQSVAFPELSAHGAYGLQEVYSPADIKTVVHYARARGIMVIPEIDVGAGAAVTSCLAHTACVAAAV
jgi:hexosaminidase